MKYTLEQYLNKFFACNQAAMMRYWGKEPRQFSAWKRANSFFIVVGEEHIRSFPRNVIIFDEGVK